MIAIEWLWRGAGVALAIVAAIITIHAQSPAQIAFAAGLTLGFAAVAACPWPR